MGLFDFFKRANPMQDYLDGFFKNIVIVDVVIASDIPMLRINGSEPQRVSADIFFRDYARMPPTRIDSFSTDADAIFWIFDTFFVFELDATKEDTRQFFVMELVNSQNNAIGHRELRDMLNATESSFKMLNLKEQLRTPTMEFLVFKEAWNFFAENHDKAIAILEKKYSRKQ